jgi:hypothetical protein
MNASEHVVVGRVTAFLQGLPGPSRMVAAGEWGVVIEDVGGRPLEVGIRVAGGLLRVQAWVAGAGVLDPHLLLHRNRLGTLVRYAHSAAGEVFVHGEIPVVAVRDRELDRLLGALVEAAAAVRG